MVGGTQEGDGGLNDNVLSFDRYSDERFDALRALVGELRERLAPLTEAQWDHVGDYMLKSLQLGMGEPIHHVLSHEKRA